MTKRTIITSVVAGGMLLLGSSALAGQPKVEVCHRPPGNPANAHVILVSPAAVRAHLAHGDNVVDCTGKQCGGDGCGGSCGTCAAPDICLEVFGVCAPTFTCTCTCADGSIVQNGQCNYIASTCSFCSIDQCRIDCMNRFGVGPDNVACDVCAP